MIRLKNACWRTGGADIVKDVTFDVHKGETFGLVGPNGSGKSSVLRMIAGALRPSAGQIEIDGRPLLQMRRREASQIVAFVAQQADTSDRLTVRDAVELGRTPWLSLLSPFGPVDEVIVTRTLVSVGMADKSERYWQGLSGGERQRVHLGRALAQQAQVLLLDEPTNHLDIHHQLSILSLVQMQGLTSLIALHDLNQALECDRVGVMSEGRMVAIGPPHKVLLPDLLAKVFNVRARIVTDPLDDEKLIRFSL